MSDSSIGKVWCARCEEVKVDPENCDLKPAVCSTCRREISNSSRKKRNY